jgi:hypothetical protein
MSDAAITFDNDNLDKPVAYIVENDLLLDAVRREIPDSLEVVYQSKIQSCRPPEEDQDCVTVCLESGARYTCDLLVSQFNKLKLQLSFCILKHLICDKFEFLPEDGAVLGELSMDRLEFGLEGELFVNSGVSARIRVDPGERGRR